MNFYRMAYEIPRTGVIKRSTFVAWPENALPFAAMLAKMAGKAYLLSVVELRPAMINGVLELVP